MIALEVQAVESQKRLIEQQQELQEIRAEVFDLHVDRSPGAEPSPTLHDDFGLSEFRQEGLYSVPSRVLQEQQLFH